MKRNFFSFMLPSRTILDNEKFFRKTFGWFYAVISIFSLLAPPILIYSMIWWNNAFQQKLECQTTYQEILKPEYKQLQFSKDSLNQALENYGLEMNNSVDCLIKATKQANYYGEYSTYGAEYKNLYINALDVKRQWDTVYNSALDRWERTNSELDILLVKYEKAKQNFMKGESELKTAEIKSRFSNQIGALFKMEATNGGNTTMAFILFSLMIILAGILNFLIWWSRYKSMEILIKVQHKFVATPIASHLLQTLGESLGLTIALWGFFSSLIFFTCNVKMGQFGLNFTDLGLISIFLPIVVGFLVLFLFSILSELLKLVVIVYDNAD